MTLTKRACRPAKWELQTSRFSIATYRGSPWLGFEIHSIRYYAASFFGRRFELAIFKT